MRCFASIAGLWAVLMGKRKCKGCKEYFSCEGLKYPVGWFHSQECVRLFIDGNMEKAKAKRQSYLKAQKAKAEKKARKQHREDKERIRSRSDWYEMLQSLVNQWVLYVRDAGEPCCTCGKTSDVKYDAGHFISRGSSPEIRFELTNIHKQCSVNCNQVGAGMRKEYDQFIIAKYGQDHLEWLMGPHPTLKERFPRHQTCLLYTSDAADE